MGSYSVPAQSLSLRVRANGKIASFSSCLTKIVFSSSSRHFQCLQPVSLAPLLLRCSLSTQPQQQEVEMPFIAHYLISSFGFSPDRALKLSATKQLRPIKSSDRVNSVITFLKESGLSDDQVRTLVSLDPYILGSNVEKNLIPRVRELMDAGFTGEILAELMQSNPHCVTRKGTISRIQFWRNFVGDSDEVLLKVLRRNRFLSSLDIDEYVVPKLNLLKEFGLSNEDILNLLTKGQACFVRSIDSLRQILDRTEQLGFSRGSPMFVSGLRVVSLYNKETLHKKEELFKRIYGWSDEEFSFAVKKYPYILSLSEENMRSKMDFLVKGAGLEPKSIASMPTLLSYSLSRLVARHNVLMTLKAKGIKKNYDLLNACVLSEKRFLDSYVVPYEKDLPGLSEAYTDSYQEKCRYDSSFISGVNNEDHQRIKDAQVSALSQSCQITVVLLMLDNNIHTGLLFPDECKCQLYPNLAR